LHHRPSGLFAERRKPAKQRLAAKPECSAKRRAFRLGCFGIAGRSGTLSLRDAIVVVTPPACRLSDRRKDMIALLKTLPSEPSVEAMEPTDQSELAVEPADLSGPRDPLDELDPWDWPESELPEQTVHFEMVVSSERAEIPVWSCREALEDGVIPMGAIYDCAERLEVMAFALETAGIENPHGFLRVRMSAAGIQHEDVAPAVGEISFQSDRYSERPDKYWRPPAFVLPELLVAMMRSHNAILAKEAAEVECEGAAAELRILETKAGVYDPSPFD
jgi:hypothetical protein